jgi:hypothetical protein
MPLGVPMDAAFRTEIAYTTVWPYVRSRCRVHPRLPALLADLDAALVGLAALIRALQAEGSQLYGDEGANAGMQRALRAMNECFDWESRLKERRPNKCIDEFAKLCEMLQPLLRQTYYPSPQEFPAVRHAWPDVQAAYPGRGGNHF